MGGGEQQTDKPQQLQKTLIGLGVSNCLPLTSWQTFRTVSGAYAVLAAMAAAHLVSGVHSGGTDVRYEVQSSKSRELQACSRFMKKDDEDDSARDANHVVSTRPAPDFYFAATGFG